MDDAYLALFEGYHNCIYAPENKCYAFTEGPRKLVAFTPNKKCNQVNCESVTFPCAKANEYQCRQRPCHKWTPEEVEDRLDKSHALHSQIKAKEKQLEAEKKELAALHSMAKATLNYVLSLQSQTDGLEAEKTLTLEEVGYDDRTSPVTKRLTPPPPPNSRAPNTPSHLLAPPIGWASAAKYSQQACGSDSAVGRRACQDKANRAAHRSARVGNCRSGRVAAPLSNTYECTGVSLAEMKFHVCACSPVNINDCRVNATATG